MNRKVIIGALITIFIGIFAFYSFQQIQPQEIENEPDWLNLTEALDLASDDNRLVMVDIYEVGCQFCRKMSREVYPSETIRAILDRSYHPVKLNGNSESNTIVYRGEKMTEKEFAGLMGVTAFPFTVILDSDGNVLDRRRGYMDIRGLALFLRDKENRDEQVSSAGI
ncbi:thioredoxin family protein [Rhodohalobacter halophilus]|uniref:thioredoxin family protein n=1 Tax=Rhodohalobacter halophilus TaxID=1812810 RepID=UPI00083F64AA|nr:thioredoxin fold domain-containing protein [Rhodohalobacter halophilus]